RATPRSTLFPYTTLFRSNKVDRLRGKDRLLPIIERWRTAKTFQEIVPISALDGTNCDRLLQSLVAKLPEHPALFPEDATSDQPRSEEHTSELQSLAYLVC